MDDPTDPTPRSEGSAGGPVVPLDASLTPIAVDRERVRPIGVSLPLAAASRALQAGASVAVTLPAAVGETYRPVANAALDALRDGGKLMQGDVGAFGDVIGANGQVAGKLQFVDATASAKGAAAAMGALQVVSFVVGQYHLHEISASLSALESGIDALDKRHDDEERSRLRAAASLLADVVAQQRAGNSIESDREQLAAARRDVDEVLDASLARVERIAAPATRASALAAHIASSKDQASRVDGLRAQRDLLESVVARFDPGHSGTIGTLAQRARLGGLLDRVRESVSGDDAPPNEFSNEIDQLSAAAADLVTRLAEVEDRERKGVGEPPDVGELARLLDELDNAAPRVVAALEIVAEAAQLSCLLAALTALAETDERRRTVALERTADHLRLVGERLRSATAVLPTSAEIEAYQTHLKRRHRWTAGGVEYWQPVGAAAVAGGAIGELLEAAAADDLLLRVGAEGQLELCRRDTTPC